MPIATDKICKQIRATPGMAIEIARTLGLHRSPFINGGKCRQTARTP